MEMHREALQLLIRDLRKALNEGAISSAKNRLSLFELMYLGQPEEKKQEENNMPKQVLLLRLETGEHQICDEYYPEDYGRVHMLPQACYGHFYESDMQLDYKKVSMQVSSIVYKGSDWPADLQPRDVPSILTYFGVST